MLKIVSFILISIFTTSNISCSQIKQIDKKNNDRPLVNITYTFMEIHERNKTPFIYVYIDNNKKIVFMKALQEKTQISSRKCDGTFVYEGIISDDNFNKITALYKRINFGEIPTKLPEKRDVYSIGACNPNYKSYKEETISFFKNGILEKSLSSQTHQYSSELKTLNQLLFQLTKEMQFDSFISNKTITEQRPFSNIFKSITVEKSDLIKDNFKISSSTNFLLWYKLSTAEKITDPNFQPKMLFEFACRPLKICVDYRPVEGNMNINGKWQVVKRGETDGRYFRFITESGESVILDIGVNFFTHTLKHDYEKWILEQN